MMEDLAVSNDALPWPESSMSTEDNNNEDEEEEEEADEHSSAKVSNPTAAQNAFNRPAPEESDTNLPKVKAMRITDSGVTIDSPQSPVAESPNKLMQIDRSRVVVDTAAPIESVKDAVSRFGGIVDWKTHKLHTLERCRFIDQELEKTHEEMIECSKRTQAAENSAIEITAELERTRKQVDELELQLSSQRQPTATKHSRGIALAAVQSFEAELSMLTSEIALAEMKMKVATEKLDNLPSKLKQVADEDDQVKFQKQAVEEELRHAMKEAEQANAELITSTSRMHAATKEKMEATVASEELAFAAINCQQETETVATIGKSADLKSISSAAAGQAKSSLVAGLIELDAAKKSEFQTLQKL